MIRLLILALIALSAFAQTPRGRTLPGLCNKGDLFVLDVPGQDATLQVCKNGNNEWAVASSGGGGEVGQIKQTFGYTFTGSQVTTGATAYLPPIPMACSIAAWNILVDAGTATIKFWKIGTGTSIPTVANSINTNGVSISGQTALHTTNTADFITTNVVAHDVIAVNLFAVATATFVHASVECVQ